MSIFQTEYNSEIFFDISRLFQKIQRQSTYSSAKRLFPVPEDWTTGMIRDIFRLLVSFLTACTLRCSFNSKRFRTCPRNSVFQAASHSSREIVVVVCCVGSGPRREGGNSAWRRVLLRPRGGETQDTSRTEYH